MWNEIRIPVSTSLTPCDAGLEQHAQVRPAGGRRGAGDLRGHAADRLPARVADVQQHPGRRLVADLDHVRARAARDERGDRALHVVVQRRREVGDVGVPLPGDRHALLARVGPVVAHVEVDEQAHPGGLDQLAERDGVGDVVVAARLVVAVGGLRVDEGPQADEVEAVGLHRGEQVVDGGRAGRLLIGDVGAEEVARQRARSRAAGPGRAARARRRSPWRPPRRRCRSRRRSPWRPPRRRCRSRRRSPWRPPRRRCRSRRRSPSLPPVPLAPAAPPPVPVTPPVLCAPPVPCAVPLQSARAAAAFAVAAAARGRPAGGGSHRLHRCRWCLGCWRSPRRWPRR